MLSINTIETAFVAPMIFIITFAMFEIAFYYLDIAKVSSSVSNAASYMSLTVGKGEDEVLGDYDIVARNASSLYNIDHVDDEMRLLDRIDSELDMRLLLLKPVRLEASIENGIIKVDEDYSAKHPLWDRFGIDSYNYKIKARVELGDFADVIRKKRVLDDMKELKNDEQIQH